MLCTNVLFLRILYYFKLALQLVSLIVPIGLIVKIGLDFYKNMISGKSAQKEQMTLISRRIIAAVIVFIIPTIVNLVMSLVENSVGISSGYESCLANVDKIEYYENLAKLQAKLKDEQTKAELLQKAQELKKKQTNLIKNNIANNITSSSSSSSGTIMGQKYNLTESQLRDIAKICQREQGSAVGAAAEASLMANRFELYGSSYGSLYNYVLTCDWWNPAKTGSYKTTELKDDILNAVREVLVMGNRTLDLFVDEHDCIDCGSYGYDITKIVNNGTTITDKTELKDHSNYIKNVTIIHNRYGAVYTFSTFPTSSSDPFGYTATAKKKYDSMNS